MTVLIPLMVMAAMEQNVLAFGRLITTQEMTEYLAALEAAQQNLRVEFEVTFNRGDDSADPPAPFEPSNFVQIEHIVSLLSQERFRIQKTWVDAHPNLLALKGRVMTLSWNGEEARVTQVGVNPQKPTQQSARIDNLPSTDVMTLPHLTWMGWWIFKGDYFHSYLDLFQHDNPSEPEAGPGGCTQWTIVYPRLRYSDIVVTAARQDGQIVLRSVERRCFRSQEAFDQRDESRLVTTTKVEYFGTMCRSMPLPDRGRRTNRSWPTDAEPFWGVADIRLISAEHVVPGDEEFAAALAPDAIVGDSRFNLAYHLGTTTLNVDGRLLQTHIPLEGDVAENLAWWVANGRFLGPSDDDAPATQPAEPHAQQDRP